MKKNQNSKPIVETGSSSNDNLPATPKSQTKRPRNKNNSAEPRIPDKVAAELSVNWCLETYLKYFPEVTEEGKHNLRKADVAPARPVNGTANCTRHASTKFGNTAESESDCELTIFSTVEHVDDILARYDQFPAIPVTYAAGRSTVSTMI